MIGVTKQWLITADPTSIPNVVSKEGLKMPLGSAWFSYVVKYLVII